MSPKAKNKSFPPVKVTEEFLELTKACAEQADEYLSDYIRRAVEQRNNMEKVKASFGTESEKKTVAEVIKESIQQKPKQEFKTFFKGGDVK